MRGFGVSYAGRPAAALTHVAVEDDPLDRRFPNEGRIGPVSRMVTRFFDAIERRLPVTPGFAEGFRVQTLLDAVRQSHATGQRIDVAPRKLA
jgi:predicted dehydrogenase